MPLFLGQKLFFRTEASSQKW